MEVSFHFSRDFWQAHRFPWPVSTSVTAWLSLLLNPPEANTSVGISLPCVQSLAGFGFLGCQAVSWWWPVVAAGLGGDARSVTRQLLGFWATSFFPGLLSTELSTLSSELVLSRLEYRICCVCPSRRTALSVQWISGEKGSQDLTSSLFVSSVTTGVHWMLSAGPLDKELSTFSCGAPARLGFYVSVPGKSTDSIQD